MTPVALEILRRDIFRQNKIVFTEDGQRFCATVPPFPAIHFKGVGDTKKEAARALLGTLCTSVSSSEAS